MKLRRFNPTKVIHDPTDDERAYNHALAMIKTIEEELDHYREIDPVMFRIAAKDWGRWKRFATKLEYTLGWKWAA